MESFGGRSALPQPHGELGEFSVIGGGHGGIDRSGDCTWIWNQIIPAKLSGEELASILFEYGAVGQYRRCRAGSEVRWIVLCHSSLHFTCGYNRPCMAGDAVERSMD